MNAQRLRAVIALELTQRLRTAAFFVMLGIFAVLLLAVTALAFAAFSLSTDGGAWLFSALIMLVLLLVLLVSPTLSGSAINGDRDAATLAPLQVTRVSTTEIVVGKFLAAWITGLAFLVVALPFLIIATLAGGMSTGTVLASLAVLVFEVGVVAAIGVGFSGILARPLFSVACTYLVIAALSVGTVIGFGLGGAALSDKVTVSERMPVYTSDGSIEQECGPWTERVQSVPRFDRVWLFLAANPFVILADATPTSFDSYGNPTDLFGQLSLGVAHSQREPEIEERFDYCGGGYQVSDRETAEEVLASATPSWLAGMLVHLALAGGLLWAAVTRTRTPARRLPPGTRIA